MIVRHKFVDYIPDKVEDGILYISLNYGTVIHNCACGCGNEVNTPLAPTAWKMIYNGESISLKPSIGNWSFECKSHYWITNNNIKWSVKWDDDKISEIRKIEEVERISYYENKKTNQSVNENCKMVTSKELPLIKKWWLRIFYGN